METATSNPQILNSTELKQKLNLTISPESTFPRQDETTSISCSQGTFEITPTIMTQLSEKGRRTTGETIVYTVKKIEKITK